MSTRSFGLLALFLLAIPATADPPPDYYAPVNDASAATLRQTLHNVIDDHKRFPFNHDEDTDAWDILELADEDPDDPDSILDLYLNEIYPKAGGGNDDYEREHSWPNSFGFTDDGAGNYPFSDCHALFLAHDSYNSSRGNAPYRYCNDDACEERPTELNHGRGGTFGEYPGQSNWRTGSNSNGTGTWETWIGRRGDVARAQFYMDARYEGGTHGGTGHAEPDLRLTDNQDLIQTSDDNVALAYMGMLSVLRQWHVQDQVDDFERRRNDVVFAAQGNRNPFIDHPEWVECLYGNVCAGTGTGEPLELRDGRFRVTLAWSTAQESGSGHPFALTDESGYFWFFDQDNVEVLVKVIDGCSFNDRFWVFAAGLTDVRVILTVEDTLAQTTRTYENFQGTAFEPIQDTDAFDTCDAGPNQVPTAAFNASYRRRLVGDFTDASTDPDGSIVAWSWDFGDGQTSSMQSPSHSYLARGTYTIRLTVTDDDGVTNSTTRTLQVCWPGGCCRICRAGQACGASCIDSSLFCSLPIGCACDDWELCS